MELSIVDVQVDIVKKLIEFLDNILNIVYIFIMKEMRIREVPDELHLKFKLLCVKKNISMNKYLIQMIKKEVEKEDKKGA